MSHKSGHIIIDSVFEIFDPTNPEYAGVREHFSSAQLYRIDWIRAQDVDVWVPSWGDKNFAWRMVRKAIITGT